jgi:NitT/TauT family transport system substrate-binding protein
MAALAGLGIASAHAADKVTLQLKWVTQAQFAGYYVAAAKGYYTDEGLDVTILPGGPDIAPEQVIAGGGADVIVDWLPAALAAREKGLALVNIAQPFKHSGLMLTCLKESGIALPAGADAITVYAMFRNLVPVIAGNIVGGSVLVALVYYVIYIRPSKTVK